MTGSTRGHTGRRYCCRIRDCHPLWSRFPSSSAGRSFCNSTVVAPRPRRAEALRFRLSSFSLAATGEVAVAFLSCGYLDVSVDRVGLVHLSIGCTIIRESRDQRLFDGFPELIAAFHALHRLLTPRHPPCALSSLTTNIQNSQLRQKPYLKKPGRHLVLNKEKWRYDDPKHIHQQTGVCISFE